jgi:hypothetical protein
MEELRSKKSSDEGSGSAGLWEGVSVGERDAVERIS